MATKKSLNWRLWVLVAAAVLVVIMLNSEREGDVRVAPVAPLCTMTVTTDKLNVRSGPDNNSPVVETITRGSVIKADRTTRNGYRELGSNRWAAQEFLTPTPGSNCG